MKGHSDFWTLYQDFFLGYHAASRSPRKRTPAGAGVLLAAYTYLVRLVACGVGGGDGGGALAKKKTETNIKYSRRPGLGAGTST